MPQLSGRHHPAAAVEWRNDRGAGAKMAEKRNEESHKGDVEELFGKILKFCLVSS